MSGIYIPNLEMPKACIIGKLPYYEYCPFFGGCSKRASAKTERPSDCPLKEVPTHGDLIDRQKLLEHRFEVYDSNEEVCEDYIETYRVLEAPAIIEASTK